MLEQEAEGDTTSLWLKVSKMYKNQFLKEMRVLLDNRRRISVVDALKYKSHYLDKIAKEPTFYLGDNINVKDLREVLGLKEPETTHEGIPFDPCFDTLPFNSFTITGKTVTEDGNDYKFFIIVYKPGEYQGTEEMFNQMGEGLDNSDPSHGQMCNWLVNTFLMTDEGMNMSPCESGAYVDSKGEMSPFSCIGPEVRDLVSKGLLGYEDIDNSTNRAGIPILMYLLKLLNCKNVVLKKETTGGKKSNSKRPELDYQTIHIKTPRPIYIGDKEYETIPFHEKEKYGMVGQQRGHFKTYTEEKPLFGKPHGVGTWWWSPIFRVSQSKDYVVTK